MKSSILMVRGLIVFISTISLTISLKVHAEVSCEKFTENKTPRGMLCLQCLHSKAPQGVTPFVNLLQESCLRRPALGFVVDGSFGFNERRLIEAVQGLSTGGRKGALHLYIYNGPAQRRWRSKTFRSFAVMDPFLFRHKILESRSTKQALAKRVGLLKNVLLYAKEQGVSISIAPALEDNLGDRSFAVALKIVQREVPKEVPVKWVRSPCVSCAVGNDTVVPKGIRAEFHTAGTNFSFKNGIISNDGEQVRFENNSDPERPSDKIPPLSALSASIKLAQELKNIYLLWIPKYQDSPPGFSPRSPDTRTYRVPTPYESEEIIKLLTQ